MRNTEYIVSIDGTLGVEMVSDPQIAWLHCVTLSISVTTSYTNITRGHLLGHPVPRRSSLDPDYTDRSKRDRP